MKILERDIQVALFDWLAWKYSQFEKVIYHVPNGRSRHKVKAKNLKRQGVNNTIDYLKLTNAAP